VTRRQAARWIEAYLAAWRSNAPADIESLFTPDAVYFTAPHRTPWQGQREIVQGWLGRADDQGDWDFRYEVLHVTDDTAYVRGWTIYEDGVVSASNEVQVPGRREARSSGLDWGVK
jgi:ketosteroid isomerase-like protein